MTGKCPECEKLIELKQNAETGEIVICPDCGIDLEVIEIAQAAARLALALQQAEDWGE